MYFTDRGIEEFEDRRGDEALRVEWLAARMRVFVDEHPEFEDAIERFATFLARDDADEQDIADLNTADAED
ncbi:MAG: DUF6104 family protein [Pseudonocardiaceae bacterium]